eukprot:751395-Hanusia_phi.AAC.6
MGSRAFSDRLAYAVWLTSERTVGRLLPPLTVSIPSIVTASADANSNLYPTMLPSKSRTTLSPSTHPW